MTQFDDPLSRFLDEAYQGFDRLFPDEIPAEPRSALGDVRKLTAYVPVSCCALTDSTGTNHCEHPPSVAKPLPWTWRARERWWDARVWLARKVAGHRWPNEEE